MHDYWKTKNNPVSPTAFYLINNLKPACISLVDHVTHFKAADVERRRGGARELNGCTSMLSERRLPSEPLFYSEATEPAQPPSSPGMKEIPTPGAPPPPDFPNPLLLS